MDRIVSSRCIKHFYEDENIRRTKRWYCRQHKLDEFPKMKSAELKALTLAFLEAHPRFKPRQED